MIFLISNWKQPIKAEKKAVKAPQIIKIFKISGEYSKINEVLKIKKIPTVTIVAAWIKADTGVGPSIASGNQICKINWADLLTEPIKKNQHIKFRILNLKPKKKKDLLKKKGTKPDKVKKSTVLKV